MAFFRILKTYDREENDQISDRKWSNNAHFKRWITCREERGGTRNRYKEGFDWNIFSFLPRKHEMIKLTFSKYGNGSYDC